MASSLPLKTISTAGMRAMMLTLWSTVKTTIASTATMSFQRYGFR